MHRPTDVQNIKQIKDQPGLQTFWSIQALSWQLYSVG